MIGVLFVSALLSPIWKGGALRNTLDFAKVWIAWILTFLLVTDFERLRRIIYIQAAAVAVISPVSIILGHSRPRLEGVIGGIYSNPNDLAFAIVLTLPFSLAFLLTAKGALVRLCWIATILIMALTLLMTASRAGSISLVISGTVCLWHFGVKGRRFYLIVATGVTVVALLAVAGGPLSHPLDRYYRRCRYEDGRNRLRVVRGAEIPDQQSARSTEHYPILGLGAQNFQVYSGIWHDVHMTYLQIAVEGGIPSLVLYLLFFARASAT